MAAIGYRMVVKYNSMGLICIFTSKNTILDYGFVPSPMVRKISSSQCPFIKNTECTAEKV
jgi:hypothetical protein